MSNKKYLLANILGILVAGAIYMIFNNLSMENTPLQIGQDECAKLGKVYVSKVGNWLQCVVK